MLLCLYGMCNRTQRLLHFLALAAFRGAVFLLGRVLPSVRLQRYVGRAESPVRSGIFTFVRSFSDRHYAPEYVTRTSREWLLDVARKYTV